MRRIVLNVLGAIALAGCGSSPNEAPGPTDSPTTLTYDFDRGDLFDDPPGDFCRSRDREFVGNLMQRIGASLPVGRVTPPEFEAFFTPTDTKSGARQAAVKYRAVFGGKPDVAMIAVGEFDPETCRVGPMRSGPIADFYLSEHENFDVK